MAGLGAMVRRVQRTSRRLRSSVPRPGGPVAKSAGAKTQADLTEREARLLLALRRTLHEQARPRVVALVSGEGAQTPGLLSRALGHARVTVLDVDLGESELHVRLAAPGRVDAVVVDETVSGTRHTELFDRVFGHLRKGGTFVVSGFRHGVEVGVREGVETLADVVSGVIERDAFSNTQFEGAAQRDRHRLLGVVDSVSLRKDQLSLISAGRAMAKLTEDQTDEMLRLAPRRGRTIEVLPATQLVSRATTRWSPGGPENRPAAESYTVPALSLREYHDVTCLPGQVVVQRNVLLPDSFRHIVKPRLNNRFLRDLGPRFARPRPTRGAEHLEGAYFHLDSEFRGHFGHAMTEQLSRLWAWEEAKRREPSLKALLLQNRRTALAEYEVLLYEAAGIRPDDLVLVKGPVTVDRLFAATPMMSQPAYVHPEIEVVWERAASGLAAQAPDRPYADRIFCSRRITKRACHNTSEVERFFADRGFDVIYPEDYALPEQARIFREASTIGGFAGSALFNTLLCNSPRHVVMVSSGAYTAKNEHMIAAVRGHRLDVAWCRPDIPAPASGWSRKAFHSPFTFDVDREGAWLRDVLDGH